MRFIRWFLISLWTPANIRFGIVYSFFVQLKFLAEIMFIISGGYFLWFGTVPSRKLLVVIFGVIFILGIVAGDILIRYNIPQKISEKNNKLNPQLMMIEEILRILKCK